jgi:hypothetical protein
MTDRQQGKEKSIAVEEETESRKKGNSRVTIVNYMEH